MKIFLLVIFVLLISCPLFSQEVKQVDAWGNLECDHYIKRLAGVFQESKDNPSARIYFFVYEGKESSQSHRNYNYRNDKSRLLLPQYGSAKAKIKSIRDGLKLLLKADLEKFVFIEAGFQDTEHIEIFLVPDGATPPKPTPTLKKMKYRKGKPRGFCLGCC